MGSNRARVKEKARLREQSAITSATGCTKNFYPSQQEAREALSRILAKARPGKLPFRVYPCNFCPGWHTTSKPWLGKKKPPWDRDPDWKRPEP